MSKLTFETLDPDTFEQYIDRATNYLIDATHIPLSDDAWTSDEYADRIYDKAKEMFEEEHHVEAGK